MYSTCTCTCVIYYQHMYMCTCVQWVNTAKDYNCSHLHPSDLGRRHAPTGHWGWWDSPSPRPYAARPAHGCPHLTPGRLPTAAGSEITWWSCEDHVRITCMWGPCEDHARIMWGSCEDRVIIWWCSPFVWYMYMYTCTESLFAHVRSFHLDATNTFTYISSCS